MTLHSQPTSGEAAPQAKSHPLPGVGRRHWRRIAPAAVATVIAFAILVGLGFWQIERMGSKQRLLARVEAGLAAPPKPLPPESEWASLKPKAYEYDKVRLTGTFLHDQELHVHGLLTRESRGNAPPSTELGFYIVTPMRLQDGSVVLVNRGYVPTGRENPSTRQEGLLAGEQTIIGVMKAPQSQGWFVPDDDPAKNQWFTRDPAKMATALGLPRVAPFIVDADATPVAGGLPVGGKTIMSFPNNHLQYAITWFALALGLLGVFFVWARQQVKGPMEGPSPSS
jgi:surfeit locus 1 family protein